MITIPLQRLLAKRLGKDWIINSLYSRNASSSPPLEAQITLFKLVRSGTVQHLKSDPTHNADDPRYEKLQQNLDQSDKFLQEATAHSQHPRFALSFYEMVNSGKSLFLNAMIGKDVLPSGGTYACKIVCMECLHGSLELPSTAWPYLLVHKKEEV